MSSIKCIIVEDEIPAAEELKYVMSGYDYIDVTAVANDGQTAIELIKDIKPEAVFMDINMPGQCGIELAKQVKELDNSIEIIFVTAYEKHAIEAFEVEALDYVLKPFDEKRIDTALTRLLNKYKNKEEGAKNLPDIINQIISKIDKEERLVKKVPCERNGKIVLVNVSEIYFCYIEGEKTYIKTKDDNYLVSYTLHQMEEKTKFFRAHRSYLVNLDNIKELYSWFNGTYKLVMDDIEKSEIPISRNNVKKLKDLLGI